jgi:hypothetical protein
LRQLKEEEQLYARIFPGNRSWIDFAKQRASSRSGPDVSASGEERLVPRVRVARQQASAVRVRPGDDERRHAHDIGGEAGRDEFLDELARRHDDLPAEMAALLGGRKLVLEVDGGRTGVDHGLRDFKRMERPAKAGLRIREDRREPIAVLDSSQVRLLVFPSERVVDPAHDVRDAVRRIQTEIGVHLSGVVAVRRDLPAAHVNRTQARAHLLDRLVPRQGAERCNIAIRIEEPPELFGAEFRKRVPDADRPAEAVDVRTPVRSEDAGPSLRGLPVLFQLLDARDHFLSSASIG